MTSSTQASPLGVGAKSGADPEALLALGTAPKAEADGGALLLEWTEARRAAGPVWRDEKGHYHVFRHADVTQVVADPVTFSSDTITRPSGGLASPPPGTLLLMDPPRHRRMRRLVTQAFSARRVDALGTRITEIAEQLLDRLAGPTQQPGEVHEFDLVHAFADPLPVTVIAELLGVPLADLPRFQNWADRFLVARPDEPEGAADLRAGVVEMQAYLQGRVTLSRAEPGADLIGSLVKAEVDDKSLDDIEIISFAALLLLAGHVTTAVLLGNVLLCLDAAPEEMAALRADPARIPLVIEETLRLRPPFLAVDRLTTRDVELAGTPIPENSFVHLWLLSANRDERVFEAPHAFRPGRPESSQVAFGHGIHFCLGAPLARMEGRIALRLLLERFADIQVRHDVELSWHMNNVLGARHLPVRVVPRGR
ncbi:MAG TPA: cytochrome P450 [Pseudonocardia sp.]|nr:cytochrome P450 [Pseudonocardia sp.]